MIQVRDGLALRFGLKVTTARLRLVAADSSTRDTSLAFPAGIESILLNLSVPGRTVGQTFRADLELFDANGFVLFSGSAKVNFKPLRCACHAIGVRVTLPVRRTRWKEPSLAALVCQPVQPAI